ncbi:hypothetical protein Thiosp_00500 [Thiorhodovibrio litoralis]|nr:hypothetical protein [Thiorhodovibrio winogradskyi]WPL10782.1 hypothetical protein Thiosp_00500 [Thiorhodovibrio litoralis]
MIDITNVLWVLGRATGAGVSSGRTPLESLQGCIHGVPRDRRPAQHLLNPLWFWFNADGTLGPPLDSEPT